MRSKRSPHAPLFHASIALSIAGVGLATFASDAAILKVGVGQTYATIQSAINASVAGDEVQVYPGGYPERINLLGRAVKLVSVDGAARTIIWSNGNAGAVVSCVTGETAACIIEGFTISGANGTGIQVTTASPTVRNCVIKQNIAANGGGVAVNGSNSAPRFTDCLFANNRATNGGGGAIFADATNGLVTCERCDFVANESNQGLGGAIRSSCSVALTDCEFRANLSSGDSGDRRGGAIYSNGPVTATGCLFIDNIAATTGGSDRHARGGAIAAHAQLQLTNCLFEGNKAESSDSCCSTSRAWGGALWCETSAATTITNCSFTGNRATSLETDQGREARAGAAAFFGGCDPVIRNCTFTSNAAVTPNSATGTGQGGTFFYEGGSAGIIEDCIVTSSSAQSEAGAMFLNGGATPLVMRTRFSACSVTNPNGNGGAVRAQDGANAFLGGCRFSGCAAGYGGGAYTRNSQVSFESCVFDGNTSANGSAIRTEGSGIANVPTVQNSFFCGNSGQSTNWMVGNFNIPDAASNTLVAACSADCNDNGIIDTNEIASGAEQDCNNSQVPDSCELASGAAADCDQSGTPDSCEVASGKAADCNGDQIPDSCQSDCDGDGIINACEIANGADDCNANGVPDTCELAGGTATDRNNDGILDSCQVLEYLGLRTEYVPIAGVADEAAVIQPTAVCVRVYAEFSKSADQLLGVYGNQAHPIVLSIPAGEQFFQANGGGNTSTEVPCVPEVNLDSFRYDSWLTIGNSCLGGNSLQVLGFNFGSFALGNGFTDADCIMFLTPGMPQAAAGASKRVLIAQFTTRNGAWPTFRVNLVGRNEDGSDWQAFNQLAPVPVLVDCNGNGTSDVLDVALGGASDCNDSGLPDACEFPDFSADCNENGTPDACDIYSGTSQDADSTGIPDECECVGDVNLDGRVNVDDIVDVILAWGDDGSSPADLNDDGIVNAADLGIVIGGYGECD